MMHRDIASEPLPFEGFVEGRKVVAVVGIDRYKTWPTLHNAVSDARGALRTFQRLGFETVTGPLIDGAATGDAIRRLVTDDLAVLGSDDSLVLFFAGHGHTQIRTLQSGQVQTGFLIPVDGDRRECHAASWLRLDTWLSDVARLPPRHILVILDACHSGIVLGSLIKWRGSAAQRGDSFDELRRRQSRRVITSALGDQLAVDNGPIDGHSLFTGCLIEGLTGGLAQNGRMEVTGSELGLYVQQRVTSYTGSMQTPDFGALELDGRGELVVAISCERQPVQIPVPVPEPRRCLPQPEPAADALIKPKLWWVVIACMLATTLLAQCTRASGTAGALVIVASLLIAALVITGRVVSTAPKPIQWLSAQLLLRKRWLCCAAISVVLGVGPGLHDRERLYEACSDGLAIAALQSQLLGDEARTALKEGVKACMAIDRDADAYRILSAAEGSRLTAAGGESRPRPEPRGDAAMITSPESLGITDPGIRTITVESGDRRLIPTDRNVGIEVDATKIWKDYDDNEVAADLAYKGKTLRVTGVVRSIDKDFLGNMILHLKSPGLVTHVMVTLRDTESAKVSSLRKGVKTTLLCTGGGLVLGTPILDDCTVEFGRSI